MLVMRVLANRMTGYVHGETLCHVIRAHRYDLVGNFTSTQFENRSFDVAGHRVERQRIAREGERLGHFAGNRFERN